eukprot:2411558-Rhodomonas_salina.1
MVLYWTAFFSQVRNQSRKRTSPVQTVPARRGLAFDSALFFCTVRGTRFGAAAAATLPQTLLRDVRVCCYQIHAQAETAVFPFADEGAKSNALNRADRTFCTGDAALGI